MYNAIKRLYPQSIDNVDFILQDDGSGVFIALWNEAKLGPVPTKAMLVNDKPHITVVTMRQARTALALAGLLPAVNAAIESLPGTAGDLARIEWEFSSEVQRDRGIVSQLGAALGVTNAQLDSLFTTASTL